MQGDEMDLGDISKVNTMGLNQKFQESKSYYRQRLLYTKSEF